MTDIRIKQRIRKLLDLASDDAAADGEIDNALRFARRLMLENAISEEDLAELDAGRELDPHEAAAREAYVRITGWADRAYWSFWKRRLADVVCDLVGSVTVYRDRKGQRKTSWGTVEYANNGKPKYRARLQFAGPKLDTEEAYAMWIEWIEVIETMARLRYSNTLFESGRNYAEGFVQALCEKVDAIRQAESVKLEGPQTTALVLLRNQLSTIEAKREYGTKWLAKEHGVRLRKITQKVGGNDDPFAREQGKADGRKADFSRNRQRRLT